MIHIKHGGLATLHQHMLALVKRLIQLELALDDHRAQPVRIAQEILHNLLGDNRLAVVHLHQNLVFHVQSGLDLLAQNRLIENVLHANTHARHLVRIGGANAAACCADGALTQKTLLHPVQHLVIRRDNMGVGRNTQAGRIRTAGLQAVNLIEQRFQVDHHAIAQHRHRVFRQHPRR